MKAVLVSLTVIAILGALVVAPVVIAQAKTIEGKVMTVDPAGKSLTLDDGQSSRSRSRPSSVGPISSQGRL